MVPTQVYFRQDRDTREEFEICELYFPTVPVRTDLEQNSGRVICRYSALPFNKELVRDLHNYGLSPINDSREHSYIADMQWIDDLGELTFPTWFSFSDVPEDITRLVIKGRTNSRKFEWNTKMFAPTRLKAVEIMCELSTDPLIGPQGLVFRQYVPLHTYEIGINGMPMTNEWRTFWYKDRMVDAGFYWSIMDDVDEDGQLPPAAESIARQAAEILSQHTNFFVVDVAEGQDGKWWVVEVNDGQMSGLSTIPPRRFYQNLRDTLYYAG